MPTPNHQLVRDYLDAYNRADWPALEALLRPDYVHHNNGQHLDIAQFRAGATWFRAGLPDFTITAVSTVAEGDRIAVRWVAAGTHTFALMGEVPTGRLMRQITPPDSGS